ncbi:MAG TPA: histidine kinase [Saprospiraceae bacterium]|nr:histidine kinase [Saprospiraceae bacterium]HMQ82366.1 histidine kinase [Saprospiraceae bacterium]
MAKKLSAIVPSSKELLFQVLLHGLVFIFYSFDHEASHFDNQKLVYFLNYALAAFVINYYLLPHFYYKKKQVPFFLGVGVIAIGVMLVEELALEPIFFPDTRAKGFPGVLFTLSQVLPVITILSGFKFAWDALGKQREVEQLRSAVQESELQFLKSQINPHFLFNNLNNLYAYAIENSPKTPEIILELSGILRYMLYECKEKYVLLTKEVEQLQNFMKISELQIEERGKVRFDAQNIRADYRIAPLILVVFVENAFKHSTASQSDQISIEVQVSLSVAGELDFICKNSFQPQSNTDSLSKGIGLENVKKRLQLLYQDAHELRIQTSINQYEVYLKMDLNKII